MAGEKEAIELYLSVLRMERGPEATEEELICEALRNLVAKVTSGKRKSLPTYGPGPTPEELKKMLSPEMYERIMGTGESTKSLGK